MLLIFFSMNISLFTPLCSSFPVFLCCRQDKLKRRLTLDFPQLVFHCPGKRNICELVFVETLSADKLIDRLPHPSGTDTTESTEVSQAESDTEHMARTTAGPQTTENTRTLYSAALILKQLLCDSPGMPLATQITSH